jgi:hypothetical protein
MLNHGEWMTGKQPGFDTWGVYIVARIPAEISKEKIPKGLEENRDIARKGGNAAKKARLEIEK